MTSVPPEDDSPQATGSGDYKRELRMPRALARELRRLARQNRRSMAMEILVILEDHVQAQRPDEPGQERTAQEGE